METIFRFSMYIYKHFLSEACITENDVMIYIVYMYVDIQKTGKFVEKKINIKINEL